MPEKSPGPVMNDFTRATRLGKRTAYEKKLIREMIGLYCNHSHGSGKRTLCPDCQMVLEYSLTRIDSCPHKDTKTFCSVCKTKCYTREYREKIREVMRFSGPRIVLIHPVMLISHMVCSITSRIRK